MRHLLAVAIVAVSAITVIAIAGSQGNDLRGDVVNGDANGDGILDVSDAVHLLVHLFRGGPPPVACADSESVAAIVELRQRMADLEAEVTELKSSGPGLACGLYDTSDRAGLRYTLFCTDRESRLRFPADDVLVRNGLLSEIALTVESDRLADLAIEIEYSYGSGGNVRILFDGEPASEFLPRSAPDYTTRTFFLFDVPAGEHAVAFETDQRCQEDISAFRLSHLAVNYID